MTLRRFTTSLVLTLAIAGLLILAVAQTAGAEIYVEVPCGNDYYTNDESWTLPENDNWSVTPNCPTGIDLAVDADVDSADPGVSTYLETTKAEIQSVKVQVSRPNGLSSGIEAGIQACRLTTCGPVVASPVGSEGELDLTRDALQIPNNATRVVITAKCVDAICPSGAAVRFSNLLVTRNDDTPPTLWLFEVAEDETLVHPSDTKWQNGLIRWISLGDDAESGLSYEQVEFGELKVCYAQMHPDQYVPDCEMSDPDDYRYIYASEVPDGHNEFALTLVNRAGLETTRTLQFKTDVTRPARPSQFQVSPQRNGWVRSRDVRIDWTNTGETVETATQSGIVGYRYDVSPMLAGTNPPTSGEDPPEVSVSESNASGLQVQVPGDGQWEVAIWTIDAAGNTSDPGTIELNVDSVKPLAPVVSPIDPINGVGAAAGRTIEWTTGAQPVSGICGYDWAFAPVAGFNPGEDPNTPLLGGSATNLTLTPSQLAGLEERPQRFHIRAYSCAGNAGDIAHIQVLVDRTAPSVVVSPGGGLIGASDKVSIAAQDVKAGTVQSGIQSVSCELASGPVPCANGSQLTLAGGQQHLIVTATDNAGNVTTTEADFVVDSSAPTGWIEPADPADPTLVRAVVNDSGSGVKSAVLEYKPSAGGSWTRLGDGFSTPSPAPGAKVVSARIPDEGELANGDYLLRVRATDGVESSKEITQRAAGDAAVFRMPLRSSSVVTARLKKSSRSKASALSRLRVDYGESPVLAGVLKRADGTPIGGAVLSVGAEQAGSPIHTIRVLTTGADGRYSWRVPAGANKILNVRFAGNLAVRGTSADAKLFVNGKVTLAASRSVARSNQKVRLRGKVFSAGAALPLIGKLVELEFSIPGRGRGWKRTLRTDAAGRFDLSFSYAAKRRPVRFKVRAISPAEPTWAFESSTSKSVSFEVRP